MLGEMLGFLILCSLLLVGLFSCFGFPGWLRFGSAPTRSETDVGQQEEEASTKGQDESQVSASEGDEDDPEAPGTSEYGVFLSFRGPDSRQGLADVLYSDMTAAGIRVFRDTDELEMGDEISEILPAIKNSKICVPIFSKTFAASPWCLREVQRMVELGKTIMPVFYTASPEDVKLRTGLFKEDLRKHEKKHGREQVKKWEDALEAVGRIKGQEVKTTGFAKFSNFLVRALLIKLKVKKKYVTNFLVKRDAQEAAVIEMLGIGSSGVRLVGVHGMGGVGKTTLVKVLFDALSTKFDCCSFLENVQESLRCNGIEFLQRQLLEDLYPKLKVFPMVDPTTVLQNRFRQRKVLIILDDVNERKQVEMIVGVLNWFGSGSRIIVTTRDKRVFTGEAQSFEVQEMNEDDALQLFSWHAFGADSPPSDYHTLSDEVTRLTGRLPLALEVIGSRLHGCEKKIWKATMEKLKKVPNRNVQEKLKLSFDALEYEQRQIFLDISCFFINKETSSASYMWEACDLFPDEGIEVLVSMSLLKLEGNRFWMHDLIRDLGRAIVREECSDEPARRSRIWSKEEALEVLRIKKGKEMVEGLLVEEHGGGDNLTNEQFSSFRKLRLLKLVGGKLAGDFELLLPKLKWFSWHRCPSYFSAAHLSLTNLVVLDLSWSSINENWAGWSMIQMAKNLKVLDVTGCCNLTTTPDLSNNTALERLIFKRCSHLAGIHSSIGKLTRLKHLDLEGCSSLTVLPEELGLLVDLEVVSVEGNGNSFHLPESIGKMCSLSVMKLQRVEIVRIPDSIGGLVNLVQLSMRNCTGLKELPDSLGDLKSLVDLDLSKTELRALPNSVGRLVKLRSLDIGSTKIEELPDTIGDLQSLVRLDMGSTKVRVLPNSIVQLVNLESLDIWMSEVEELPDAIGDLQSLVMLDLSKTKVSVLPNSVGRLAKLQSLYLRKSEVKELPDSLGDVSELRALGLGGCKIRELPSCIGKLTKLKELEFGCSGFITEIPEEITGSLPALTELFLTGSCITKFDEVSVSLPDVYYDEDCCSLETEGLEENIGNSVGLMTSSSSSGLNCMPRLPSTLTELNLSYVTAETSLPDFSNLENLREVLLRHCSLPNNVDELEALLRNLSTIILESCSKELVDFCCGLHNLRSLAIWKHEGVLLDFPRLLHLDELYISGGDELVEIRGLEKLESLKILIIQNCRSLETVGTLSGSTTLSRLSIDVCPKLREIEGIHRLVFQYIRIKDCPSLRNIDELKKRCLMGDFDASDLVPNPTLLM